jgi:predicted DsbA family dithiol-disulfide isomerase
VTTDIVMVQEFPDLAQTYSVSSVPLTVIEPLEDGAGLVGEGTSVLGAQAEGVFLAALAEVGGTSGPAQDSAS